MHNVFSVMYMLALKIKVSFMFAFDIHPHAMSHMPPLISAVNTDVDYYFFSHIRVCCQLTQKTV